MLGPISLEPFARIPHVYGKQRRRKVTDQKLNPVTIPDKAAGTRFLEDDLYDALRWLFVGAVAWKAAKELPNQFGRLEVLGMLTSFVQARSLYEFFYQNGHGDDARVRDFAPAWNEGASRVYSRYMAHGTPANKRVFHLVYQRETHAGGTGHDGPDHLKNQVVEFAKDIRKLTEVFIGVADPDFRVSVESALQRALDEAELAAKHYGINNPL